MTNTPRDGRQIIPFALKSCRSHFFWAALTSVISNFAVLIGPLYMLQVYDRVLSSGSVETLVSLSVLLIIILIAYGASEYIRTTVHTRMGARFKNQLLTIGYFAELRGPRQSKSITTKEIETIQHFLGSGPMSTWFDIPWSFLYLTVLFILHPVLGSFALGICGLVLLCSCLAGFGQRGLFLELGRRASNSDSILRSVKSFAIEANATGIGYWRAPEWAKENRMLISNGVRLSEIRGIYVSAAKTTKLLGQSLVLGLGAYLVIRGELSAGSMIAASILLGKSVGPIDKFGSLVPTTLKAFYAYKSLKIAFRENQIDEGRYPFPAGRLPLRLENVELPGWYFSADSKKPINLALPLDNFIAISGKSGSGKSAFVYQICSPAPPKSGKLFWRSLPVAMIEPASFNSNVGFLAENPQIFAGTMEANILGFRPEISKADFLKLVEAAGLKEYFFAIPQEYKQQLMAGDMPIPSGIRKRLALARAISTQPEVLVFDDPTTSLDSCGKKQLMKILRLHKGKGKGAIIATNDSEVLAECDYRIVLRDGQIEAVQKLNAGNVVIAEERKNVG